MKDHPLVGRVAAVGSIIAVFVGTFIYLEDLKKQYDAIARTSDRALRHETDPR